MNMKLDGTGGIPFSDATIPVRRVLVFKEEQVAINCVEKMHAELNQASIEATRGFGINPESVIAGMGQQKWDLFREEQPWVYCESITQFDEICAAKKRLVQQMKE